MVTPSGTHPNLEAHRGPVGTEFGGHALEDLRRQMPNLRRPRRMVGAHDEGPGHQAKRPDVNSHGFAYQLFPASEDNGDQVRATETQPPGHRTEGFGHRHRPAIAAPVVESASPGHGCSVPVGSIPVDSVPPSTRTTRSGVTAAGGSTAVVRST